MTEKRFIYCFEGIEDKWETVEEYKYTPCTKDGFQDLCYMLNELNDENEQLKQTISDWMGSYDGLYEDVKRLEKENENFKKALRIVYSTKLTEPTKHTIEQIAKHCRVDLE